MFYLLMSSIMSMLLPMIIILVSKMMSLKTMMDKEKMSSFECGFNPMSSPRTPFSIQFFLMAVLFLIFDIEIVIMLPIIITMKWNMTQTWILTTCMFMTTLIISLYYEWKNSMLEWAK